MCYSNNTKHKIPITIFENFNPFLLFLCEKGIPYFELKKITNDLKNNIFFLTEIKHYKTKKKYFYIIKISIKIDY